MTKPKPAPDSTEIPVVSASGEQIGFVHLNRVTGNWHAFKGQKWIGAFRYQDDAEKAVRESRDDRKREAD